MPQGKGLYKKDGTPIDQSLDPNTHAVHGYVFVKFFKPASAQKALSVKGHEILGKKIDVERAFIIEGSVNDSLSKLQLKIFMKGFPHDTSQDELISLLTPFGEVRSLRLVNKGGRSIAFAVFKEQSAVKKLVDEKKIPFNKSGQKYWVEIELANGPKGQANGDDSDHSSEDYHQGPKASKFKGKRAQDRSYDSYDNEMDDYPPKQDAKQFGESKQGNSQDHSKYYKDQAGTAVKNQAPTAHSHPYQNQRNETSHHDQAPLGELLDEDILPMPTGYNSGRGHAVMSKFKGQVQNDDSPAEDNHQSKMMSRAIGTGSRSPHSLPSDFSQFFREYLQAQSPYELVALQGQQVEWSENRLHFKLPSHPQLGWYEY